MSQLHLNIFNLLWIKWENWVKVGNFTEKSLGSQIYLTVVLLNDGHTLLLGNAPESHTVTLSARPFVSGFISLREGHALQREIVPSRCFLKIS